MNIGLGLGLSLGLGRLGLDAVDPSSLLTGDANGLAIDFSAPASRQVVSKNAGALTYQSANAFFALTLPQYAHPVTGEVMFRCDPARTNSFINSSAPATQTRTLAAATYTLWVEGPGSITLSGGPTGTATEGNPVTYTLGGSTDVTFTVSGSLTFAQNENGAFPTAKIATAGSSVTRSLVSPTALFSAVPGIGSEYLIYAEGYVGPTAVTAELINIHNDTGLSNYIRLGTAASGFYLVRVNIAGSSTKNSTTAVPLAANSRFEVASLIRNADSIFTAQGSPTTNPGIYKGAVFTPTKAVLGNWFNTIGGTIWFKRFAIVPKSSMPVKDVAPYYARYSKGYTAYDMFVVAGQSNTLYGQTLNGSIDVSGGHVWQQNQIGTLLAADEPLASPIPLADGIGHALPFARDALYPSTGREVLLLPCGVAATGYVDNRWNPGDDLFNLTCSMVGVALAKYPNATLRSFLWMQGEQDALAGWSQSTYAAALDAMIAGFRSALSLPNLPFVICGMRPGWVAADVARQPVQDALAATPGRVAHTAYANPGSIGSVGTGVHYTAAEQRLLGPGPVFAAYQALT